MFVVVVGNAIKARILATLGVEAPRVTSGEIQLFTSPSTVTDRRPLLVASADIPRKLAQSGKTFKCHDTSIRTPSLDGQHIDKPIDFASLIHHHILMPFSDVICVIAKDIGGWTKVVELMKAWVKLDKPTEHGPFACLVVVLHGEMSSHVPENLMKKLRCCFSDVRFHKVPNGADETQQYVKLKNKLLAIGKEGQLLKEKRKFLFSAHHLAGFLDLAGESANLERKQALDLIHLSRSGLSRIEDIEAHVARFVGSVDSFQALKSFAIPVISSCFILHQYPPGMHFFEIGDVFRSIYEESCQKVCCEATLVAKEAKRFLDQPSFVALVRRELSLQYKRFLTLPSAAEAHKRLMGRFSGHWSKLRSHETCFSCVARRPQFGLSCGHSVCENCVKVFGNKNDLDPWVYHVSQCFICGAGVGSLAIRVRPENASIRVLSIDGGGVRGVAPLQFLRTLQDQLRLPNYPIQRHFDLIYGTSSGAITTAGLVMNGWDIAKCLATFKQLSHTAFQRRASLKIPLVSAVLQFLISIICDGRYPPKNLESVLQRVFGRKCILDSSVESEMGILAGIIVTNIKDTSASVFTNYNAVGNRKNHCDYSVMTTDPAARPLLWEIIRCATAAPFYFRPRHIAGVGTFQDGGLLYNNPASIALHEVGALFPNTREPSLFVSLGTGCPLRGGRQRSSRCFWKDSFIPRLIRAFWKLGDSDRAWKQLLSQQTIENSKSGFFRFDVKFPGAEPHLDDLSKMEEIEEAAQETMLQSPELNDLVSRIRAELFVFTLDGDAIPYRADNQYECTGSISCRLRANTAAFDALMTQLNGEAAFLQINNVTLPGDFWNGSCSDANGNFCTHVKIRVSRLDEPFQLCLHEGSGGGCHISGSPFTIQKLAEDQKLGARFGTIDHRRSVTEDSNEGRRKRQRIK